jgi:hypothetical protein
VPKDCNPRRKKSGESDAQYRKRCGPRPLGQIKMGEKKNPRIPRKKGQPRGSKKHSDLYTDENPKGTIKGLKFATVKDAKASVSKIKGSGKSHAHKIQAAVAMEQRAREMGKTSQAAVYRAFINKMKKITKKKNENVKVNHDGKAAPYGSGYEKVEEKKWSQKYKKSIDCSNPKGFSQKAHCAGKKKKSENVMKLTKSKLKEMIEEEYFNYLVEKTYQLNQPNGLITSHKQRKNLMYIHQHMQMLGLLNNIKKQVVVGKRVNNENHRKKRNLLGWI